MLSRFSKAVIYCSLRFPGILFILFFVILGEACLFCSANSSGPSGSNPSQNKTRPANVAPVTCDTSEVTPVYTYKIVNTYPHDQEAWTQGLVFNDGVLYEGTGRYGQSTLRKVELETGKTLQIHRLPAHFFGEGITVFGDKVIQLTWRSNIGFVYDKVSFELLAKFTYPTEGWGVTHDGKRLIMSDGTSMLHFLDPKTLKMVGQIEVYDTHGLVAKLNELEYVQGEIYANVWPTERIARIRPETGQVVEWIDLEGLLGPVDPIHRDDVLNGIAYDTEHDRLFVTGKMWPKLFEIQLVCPGK
jgi:glutamine cyclotransferase